MTTIWEACKAKPKNVPNKEMAGMTTVYEQFMSKTHKMTDKERSDRAFNYIVSSRVMGFDLPKTIIEAIEQKLYEDEDD